MSKRILFGAVGVFFLVVLILTGGHLALEYLVFNDTERILAGYPGFNIQGYKEGWSWKYDRIIVKSPSDADLDIQLGTFPAVPVREVTPDLIARYLTESLKRQKLVVVQDEGVKMLGDSSWVRFRAGVLTEAQFAPDDGFVVVYRGSKVTRSMSQRELERIFGKPESTYRFSLW